MGVRAEDAVMLSIGSSHKWRDIERCLIAAEAIHRNVRVILRRAAKSG